MSGAPGPLGPGSGRRAVLRWSWRLFRRDWRQQVLVLTLLTVTVAAAVVWTTVVVNADGQARGVFGDAGALVRIDATDPTADATLAAVRARFGDVEVIAHRTVAVPGLSARLDVRQQAPDGRFGHPMLALRAGRYPVAADEVALTDGAARALGARLGEQVTIGRDLRTVVGRVEDPEDLVDEFVLASPADTTPPGELVVLVAGTRTDPARAGAPPSASTGDGSSGASFGVMVAPPDHAFAPVVLAVVTLAMALVGLLAVAGFVVVAQRRRRQLGLLAAIGATDRHLRAVVVGDGVLVGLAAALLGGVLGLLGWLAAAPAVEHAAERRIDRTALPWGLLGTCLLLAVLVSAAAAWWPARRMARVPVVEALARRPERPQPVHRSLLLAVALLGVGLAMVAGARVTGTVRPLRLIGGLLGVVAGGVLAAPAAIRVLGRCAGRLPLAPRLALRDLARAQARTSAALAAITLALGTSVAVVGVAGASEPAADEGNVAATQLVVRLAGAGPVDAEGPGPTLTSQGLAAHDADAATVAAAVPGARIVPLEVAIGAHDHGAGVRDARIEVGEPLGPNEIRGHGTTYVATPELLALLGIDPARVGDTTDIVTGASAPRILVDPTTRPDGTAPDVVQRFAELPSYELAPATMVTTGAMARHGWTAVRAGWLVQADHALTSAERSAAQRAAAAVGLGIEARNGVDGFRAVRTGAVLVGGLLALAIVAMAIGLLRGEAARDVRTLAATGASARTRRALTACTAAALAAAGVVLGVAGAAAALVAAFHADLGRLGPAPVLPLLALAIGLPTLAGGGGWALAGREPALVARDVLD